VLLKIIRDVCGEFGADPIRFLWVHIFLGPDVEAWGKGEFGFVASSIQEHIELLEHGPSGLPNFVRGLFNRFWINWASKAKQGQSNTMTIDSNAMDRTGGPRPKVMVLDCPCLALEAQWIQNLLNKPHTKFGSHVGCVSGL